MKNLSLWLVLVDLAISSTLHQHHCRLDSLEDFATVCVQTPTSDCTTETTRDGIRILTDQECYKVVKTVCKEDTEVVNNEVCAIYYDETKVEAEIKTVTASFEKVCRVEEPYGTPAGPDCTYRKTRHVCHKEPRLVPLVKKVDLTLPRPAEKCVNRPILLPRVSCKQVEERRCMKVPVVEEGLMVNIEKCSVTYDQEECVQVRLNMPRQACPSKITNVKNIYEYVEETGYGLTG